MSAVDRYLAEARKRLQAETDREVRSAKWLTTHAFNEMERKRTIHGICQTMITVLGGHGIYSGDTISIYEPNNSLWLRFIAWILFRPSPTILRYYKIGSVSDTTLTIDTYPTKAHHAFL